MVQDAAWAVGLTGLADAATVEDEEVREEGSLSFGHHSQEITLYLFGVVVFGEAEATRDAPDVGVNDHALVDAEGVAQHHVGGLAAHAGESDEIGHGAGNLSAVILDECASHALQGAGLVAEETYGPDLLLQLRQVGLRVVLRGVVLLEETFRDLVDSDVGALGGEDGRHQKLKRVLPLKLGPGFWICFLEARYYLAYRGGGAVGMFSACLHDNQDCILTSRAPGGSFSRVTGTFAQTPIGPISY